MHYSSRAADDNRNMRPTLERNTGSTSRNMHFESPTHSHTFEAQPIGLIDGIKQKLSRYWRGNRPETQGVAASSVGTFSHRSDLQLRLAETDGETGWFSYISQRTIWNSVNAYEEREPRDNRQEVKRRILRTKVKPVIRTKSMESVIKTKRSETLVRSATMRRSLSVPGNEMKKVPHHLMKSVSISQQPTKARQQIRIVPNASFHTHEERIVEQTKDFCRDYIVFKLRRNSLLSRVKISRGPGCDQWLMQEIHAICGELERRNPTLCKNLSKQIGITLRSEEVLRKVFFEFGSEIVTTDVGSKEECHEKDNSPAEMNRTEADDKSTRMVEITWGRIMAIFVIAGALAIDCVKQGHSELVNELIEYCGEFFLCERVVDWIISQGGWETLSEFNSCRVKDSDTTSTWNVVLISACVIASLVLGVGISNLTVVGV